MSESFSELIFEAPPSDLCQDLTLGFPWPLQDFHFDVMKVLTGMSAEEKHQFCTLKLKMSG